MEGSVKTVVRFVIFLSIGLDVATSNEVSTSSSSVNPKIEYLHITSHIQSRFATTHVKSQLRNTGDTAMETTFSVRLPRAAFIMNFSMEIDGKVYPGIVKEKEAAKKQYQKAKKRGQSAGQVKAVERNTNSFKVAVNVASNDSVKFSLTYQELLERKLGFYEHKINIEPQQIIADLQVNVFIKESREITFLKVPPIRESAADLWANSLEANPLAVISHSRPKEAHISYSPSIEDQMEASDKGIAGQFIVQYDIERALDPGEIHVVDGYFVHYFAPVGLDPVAKNVLFIIDQSGSMDGTKFHQTKEALKTIVSELPEKDYFNIITFSDSVTLWNTEGMVRATKTNVKEAIKYIRTQRTLGGTNINDALSRGIQLLKIQESKIPEKRVAMIMFLTDGDPTSGITNPGSILENIQKNSEGKYAIYSLGFGHNMNFKFLQQISAQNLGVARRIFEDSDADLQLKGFYAEVATPILTDVEIKYLDGAVVEDTLTAQNFNHFFQGSEIVVAGQVESNELNKIPSLITAETSKGSLEFDLDIRVERADERSEYSHFTERLWAYMTIKKLVTEMLQNDNATVKEENKERILQLSLKYNFVTPVTSMVVTKPEKPAENTDTDEDEIYSVAPTLSPRRPHKKMHSAPPARRPPSQSRQFVDNDPHFLVAVKGLEEAVCFDIKGKEGQIYQLIYDQGTDTVVNGYVVEETVKGSNVTRTYFGKIAVMHRGITTIITPLKVTVNGTVYRWKTSMAFTVGDVHIDIQEKYSVTLTLTHGITFNVLRHMGSKHHSWKVDYLGFYIEEGSRMSEAAHGLIGQFQHQFVKVHKKATVGADQKLSAQFRFYGPYSTKHIITARLGNRRNMEQRRHVPCWFVRNNGRGLLVGSHDDYLIPWLDFKGFAAKYKSLVKNISKKPKYPTIRI